MEGEFTFTLIPINKVPQASYRHDRLLTRQDMFVMYIVYPTLSGHLNNLCVLPPFKLVNGHLNPDTIINLALLVYVDYIVL